MTTGNLPPTHTDLKSIRDATLATLPTVVTELLKIYGGSTSRAAPGLWLAGGYIRDIAAKMPYWPKDIDLWPATDLSADEIAAICEDLHEAGYTVYEKHGYADRFCRPWLPPIDLITEIRHTDPVHCITNLDFRACRVALYWDGTGWAIVAASGWLGDIMGRRMHYLGRTDRARVDGNANRSWKRAIEFASRGWQVDIDDLPRVDGHHVIQPGDAVAADIHQYPAQPGCAR